MLLVLPYFSDGFGCVLQSVNTITVPRGPPNVFTNSVGGVIIGVLTFTLYLFGAGLCEFLLMFIMDCTCMDHCEIDRFNLPAYLRKIIINDTKLICFPLIYLAHFTCKY